MNRTAVNEALGVSFLDLLKLAKHSYEKGKESIEGNKNTSSYSYNSAAESSSKLIAVFPILASRSVSSDTANKIAKYIEARGCIIIQLALTANNIANSKNGIEYLRKFHQNLDIGG